MGGIKQEGFRNSEQTNLVLHAEGSNRSMELFKDDVLRRTRSAGALHKGCQNETAYGSEGGARTAHQYRGHCKFEGDDKEQNGQEVSSWVKGNSPRF
jgi:hypothetical protein